MNIRDILDRLNYLYPNAYKLTFGDNGKVYLFRPNWGKWDYRFEGTLDEFINWLAGQKKVGAP